MSKLDSWHVKYKRLYPVQTKKKKFLAKTAILTENIDLKCIKMFVLSLCSYAKA